MLNDAKVIRQNMQGEGRAKKINAQRDGWGKIADKWDRGEDRVNECRSVVTLDSWTNLPSW